MEGLGLVGVAVEHYRGLWPTDPCPEAHAVQAILDEEEHPGARTARPEDVADYRFATELRASGLLERVPK